MVKYVGLVELVIAVTVKSDIIRILAKYSTINQRKRIIYNKLK